MIYLQLRVKMPDGALAAFLRALEDWQLEAPRDQQAAMAMAMVLEATSLTRTHIREQFAGLAIEIPYRQIDKQAWPFEG
jgi:hypothetical protein